MVIIIMGISGSGKTTIGLKLAERLDLPFYDADDYHPKANIRKMASGKPLNDDDRRPWLEILAKRIRAWQRQGGAVLACSALKESYRNILRSLPDEQLKWVFLDGSRALIRERMEQRSGHFFDANMIDSQLEALEKPAYGIHIDIRKAPGEIVGEIVDRLK